MITRNRIQTIAVGAACFAIASIGVRADVSSSISPPVYGIADGADRALVARVDATGHLQIGGTVAVANMPAQQMVAGTVSVTNFPSTQPVSGQVSITNLPATQSVKVVSSTPVLLLMIAGIHDGSIGLEGAFFDASDVNRTPYQVAVGKTLVVDVLSVRCPLPAGQSIEASFNADGAAGNVSFGLALVPQGGVLAGTAQWGLSLPAGMSLNLFGSRNSTTGEGLCQGSLAGHLVDAS